VTASSASVLVTFYVAGAIPFAQILARLKSTTDLRDHGIGTVSASALEDVAGIGPVITARVLTSRGHDRSTPGRPAATPVTCRDRRRRRSHWAQLVAFPGWCGRLRDLTGDGCAPGYSASGSRGSSHGPRRRSHPRGDCARNTRSRPARIPILSWTRCRAGAVAAVAVLIQMLVKRLVGNRRAATPSTVSVHRPSRIYRSYHPGARHAPNGYGRDHGGASHKVEHPVVSRSARMEGLERMGFHEMSRPDLPWTADRLDQGRRTRDRCRVGSFAGPLGRRWRGAERPGAVVTRGAPSTWSETVLREHDRRLGPGRVTLMRSVWPARAGLRVSLAAG
jgi:hypothetical protein